MHADPICLHERDSLSTVKEVLEECDQYPYKHQAFPVVHLDEEKSITGQKARPLRGVVSRKQLLDMMSSKFQSGLHLHPAEAEELESSVNLMPCTRTVWFPSIPSLIV